MVRNNPKHTPEKKKPHNQQETQQKLTNKNRNQTLFEAIREKNIIKVIPLTEEHCTPYKR